VKFTLWEEGYICGAVTRREGYRLARLAATIETGCIVELGSHSGSSAAWLAMGMQKADNHRCLFCVDPWDDAVGERMDQHAESAVREMFDARMRFMASAGYIDPADVHPIKGYSVDVAADWSEPIGLLHVDALHTYDAVKADVEAWAPHVVTGGVIVFHDSHDPRFGVRQVADELARRPEWTLTGAHPGDRRKLRHGQMVVSRG
jgi:cephalosporin hydroxylase